MMKYLTHLICCLLVTAPFFTDAQKINGDGDKPIIPAAERMEVYLPLLKGKKVGVFANQTSLVKRTHLVDTLVKSGINVVKIFGPEHGFRGNASAGEKVTDGIDQKTGINVISLYGKHRKPTTDDLKGVDVLLFDIQDIGVRFYTYISSLQEYMEAAFEHGIPLIVLDRPNPNGFYVDGPILDTAFKSFIGMQPIPIVYGMTIAEYAFMIAGERWLSKKANEKYDFYRTAKNSADTPFHFQVIKNANYDHNSKYVLPVMPSPNLRDMQAIYWYPSTCLIEGTVLSEGRGTEKPFLYFGHPKLPKNLFSFIPKPNEGAKSSKLYFQKCYGWDVSEASDKDVLKKVDRQIQLSHLLKAYALFPGKDTFFLKNNFIHKLAGNDKLKQQVVKRMSEKDIKKSWKPGLDSFKIIRKKYLLYKDFEDK